MAGLTLATGKRANDTALQPYSPTFEEFANTLGKPDLGGKDGSYFIRCGGTKRTNDGTTQTAAILILDGDKGLDGGSAPHPQDVHNALLGLGINHCIYSSYSNTPDTHKYRVVIPCEYARDKLKPLLGWLFGKLHAKGVELANAPENATWSQAWFFPRVSEHSRACFTHYVHLDGVDLHPSHIPQRTPAVPAGVRTPSSHTPATDNWKQRLDAVMEQGRAGEWHHTRTKVGTTAGGLVASGAVLEADAIRYIEDWHTAVCDASGDDQQTRTKELRALHDGFKHGLASPLQDRPPQSPHSGIDWGMPPQLDAKGLFSLSNATSRPYFAVHQEEGAAAGGWGKAAGVWYHAERQRDGVYEPNDIHVSSPIWVDAQAHDGQHDNHALMLRFTTSTGVEKTWLMPKSLCGGNDQRLAESLLARGVSIYGAAALLRRYLLECKPDKTIVHVARTGWLDGSFVLPDTTIGRRDDVVFMGGELSAEYGTRGSVEGWRDSVGVLCTGNALMTMQASAGFAGALLDKVGMGYAGFHVYGDSSTGKSTGQLVATSIWGGTHFGGSWKATGNGLEAKAALHSDGLLALDELGDSKPPAVNETLYALGNGQGKQRATITGTARAAQTWRVVLLSTGEKTLSAHLATAGITPTPGQDVRFAEIPVFGKHGAFDNLHGMTDGGAFSKAVCDAVQAHHGITGRAFLARLVDDKRDFKAALEAVYSQLSPSKPEPQVGRVQRYFALAALAGELATEYGLTGWKAGAATTAVKACFAEWLYHRGGGSLEDRQILDSVRRFVETYGDARFTAKKPRNEAEMAFSVLRGVRAGWFEMIGEDKRWLFTASGLQEATKGFDLKRVITALVQAGWLSKTQADRQTVVHKIDGTTYRLYQIQPLSMQLTGGAL